MKSRHTAMSALPLKADVPMLLRYVALCHKLTSSALSRLLAHIEKMCHCVGTTPFQLQRPEAESFDKMDAYLTELKGSTRPEGSRDPALFEPPGGSGGVLRA